MNHILNCGHEIKLRYDPRSNKRNFGNCVEKPGKFRTSTGFKSMTLWYRCDCLTNWARKAPTLEDGHLWVVMYPWWMINERNDIWNNKSYIELRMWNQVKLWCSQLWTQFYQLRRDAWKTQDFNGVESVTSRYRTDCLTNWAMKPLTMGAGHLWLLMFPWWMNQRWNDIWNKSFIDPRIWSQVKLWSSQF